jgi:hypothetical protein
LKFAGGPITLTESIGEFNTPYLILVPAAQLEAYKSADIWSTYENRIYSDESYIDSNFIVADGILLSYIGNESSVIIPNYVTQIGDYAFIGNYNIKEVTLHKNITSIGISAFESCAYLETVNIPEDSKLINIGESAFQGAEALTSFTIPLGVTEIQANTFNRSGLKEIYIHDAITSIGDYSFAMSTIAQITFSENATVSSIGEYAFESCLNIKTFNMPDTIASIGVCAFANCHNLLLNIPDSVNSIGEFAFYADNISLLFESGPITLSKAVADVALILIVPDAQLEAYKGATIWKDYAARTFPKSWLLDDYYIVDGDNTLLAYIGHDTIITIPDYITKIGDRAFSYYYLKEITISSNVTAIGDYAFYGCYYLDTVNIPQDNKLTYIGLYAFSLTNLSAFTIPLGVTEILEGVFSNSPLQYIYIHRYITSIGDYAFESSSYLTKITFDDKIMLTKIGESAFDYCISLKSITIPASVETIGISAFNFSGLRTISFSAGAKLKLIEENAFKSCNLVNLILPSSVEEIGDGAFVNCGKLESIYIGANIKKIGEYLFLECYELQTIYMAKESADGIDLNEKWNAKDESDAPQYYDVSYGSVI